MADLFPALALGDCLNESQAVIIRCKLGGTVTKGQIVIFSAHVAGELPTVVVATAAHAQPVGVAMKGGVSGDIIPVGILGIFKVRSAAGVTGGVAIVTGAGTVETVGANTFEKMIGRALQTFGAGDDGLAYISIG